MKSTVLLLILIWNSFIFLCQGQDSVMVKKIFDEALSNKTAYENLRYLTTKIGGRVTGSPQAAAAVEWAKQVMQGMKPDTVYLQPVKVPVWVRGEKEFCRVNSSLLGSQDLSVCALGLSIGTGTNGIQGKIVEVKSLDELKNLGEKGVAGKIVFFNKIGDPTFYYTFEAYDKMAFQRVHGASEAAKYGAIGVIVRSLTLADDDIPHTGMMRYDSGVRRIPAIAVSTKGADMLDFWLSKDPQLNLFYKTGCRQDPDGLSYNVIAEIKGSEFPDQIMTVGGHIDSWDLGQGAHDDGSGVVQSMEIIRLYRTLGIRPRHTLRVVAFIDEEIAQSGAKKYAQDFILKNEKLFLAMESDRGGTTPLGFSINTSPEKFKNILKFRKYFEDYGIYQYTTDGSGVDINPLKKLGAPMIALVPDSQPYLDYHHSANDTFDKVNHRELQLGSAAMATLIYLLDKYGY